MSNEFDVLVLPGDGIGPEVTAEAVRVLEWFADRRKLPAKLTEGELGAATYKRLGTIISDKTQAALGTADLILFGAMGDPVYDGLSPAERRKGSLLTIRKSLGLFANVRPIRALAPLASASTLRPEVIEGVDMIVLRELTGGVYFGQPRGITTLPDGRRRGLDTQVYDSDEIERIARFAFELARTRRNRVCSVEKSNVMESGKLWRAVVTELHEREFSDVALSHMYADNAAMQLVRNPRQFDVMVTDNLFGDVLSDCAAMITGSLGMLPSASLGAPRADGRRPALYEPIHGSAPDIAGQGIANPLGAILSVAMALRHSMVLPQEADLLEHAVGAALAAGARTADLAERDVKPLDTKGMGDAVLAALERAA